MDFSLSRNYRENNTEGWTIHTKVGKQLCVDKIIIFFEEDTIKVYFFSDSDDRLNNIDYINAVINLVHDLFIDFELIRRKITFDPSEIPLEAFLILAKGA